MDFPAQFCQGNTSKEFDIAESREVPLKGDIYDFSVDYNVFDKI